MFAASTVTSAASVRAGMSAAASPTAVEETDRVFFPSGVRICFIRGVLCLGGRARGGTGLRLRVGLRLLLRERLGLRGHRGLVCDRLVLVDVLRDEHHEVVAPGHLAL